jgi:hypothetical protein
MRAIATKERLDITLCPAGLTNERVLEQLDRSVTRGKLSFTGKIV